jgi:thiamine pyrophosphate-dependent acetolactate synthase large subunit-like protein
LLSQLGSHSSTATKVIAACLRRGAGHLATNLDAWQQSCAGRAKNVRVSLKTSPTAPRKIDIGIVGDCKAVLRQLIEASAKRINADHFSVWRRTLSDGETAKRQAPGANKPMDDTPIHPLRLCDEIKNFMQRDAILVVDGQEILNFGRQSMPTF